MMRNHFLVPLVALAMLVSAPGFSQDTTATLPLPAGRDRSIGVFMEIPDARERIWFTTGVFYQWQHRRWMYLRAGLYYANNPQSSFNRATHSGTGGNDTLVSSFHQSTGRAAGLSFGMEGRRQFWGKLWMTAGWDARLGVGREQGNSNLEYLRYDNSAQQPGYVVVRQEYTNYDHLLVQWNVRPYVGTRLMGKRLFAGVDLGLCFDQTIRTQSSVMLNFNVGFPSWRFMAGWRI